MSTDPVDAVLELVDAVLEACRRRRDDPALGWPHEILADRYTVEEVMAMMEALDDAGILDYGVSLRSAWVADYDGHLAGRVAAFKAGQDYDGPEPP